MKSFCLVISVLILHSCTSKQPKQSYITEYSTILGKELSENFKNDPVRTQSNFEFGRKFYIEIKRLKSLSSIDSTTELGTLISYLDQLRDEHEVNLESLTLLESITGELKEQILKKSHDNITDLLDTIELIGMSEIRKSLNQCSYKYSDVQVEIIENEFMNDTNNIRLRLLAVDSLSLHRIGVKKQSRVLEYQGNGIYLVQLPGVEIKQNELEGYYEYWTLDSLRKKEIK